MRHEADFERWLADWIESGPYEAPDRTIERAIAYADTHRQRRITRSAVWRSAMDRMHLTPVVAPSARNGWLLAAAVVAVVVLITAAIVGSGTLRFGGTSEPLPAVGGSVTPTVAPSPVSVTGSESCTQTSVGTSAVVRDVTDYRGVIMSCTDTASDPRVSGTSTVSTSIDERADGSADLWGTFSLSNADGGWTGRWFGTVDKGYTTHHIEALASGSGAYAALVYRFRLTGDGSTFTITGRIEPVAAAVHGTETCTVTDGGLPGVNAGDVGAIRGVVFSCVATMPDPRVSGTATIPASKDQRSDETGEIWGQYVLQNADGSWQGRWSGTADTADHLDGILTGKGAYEGLEYRIHIEGIGGPSDTVSGTIVPAL